MGTTPVPKRRSGTSRAATAMAVRASSVKICDVQYAPKPSSLALRAASTKASTEPGAPKIPMSMRPPLWPPSIA